MEESVLRAMEKWPDVKAVFGWLTLDCRGRWLLRGRPVDLANSIAFINGNYTSDERGRWFFQNGPQRVFVTLEATPFVYHFEQGELVTHTGQTAQNLQRVLSDDQGCLIMVSEYGPGLLIDRDLEQAIDYFRDPNNLSPTPEALETFLETPQPNHMYFYWQNRAIPIEPVKSTCVPLLLGFEKDPR